MAVICIISPSLQMGGIEKSLSVLANEFVKQGHRIHFITLFPFQDFFELDSAIIIYRPPFKFYKKQISCTRNFLYYYKMLSPFNGHVPKLIKNIKPDTILTFGDWYPHLIMLGLRNKFPFYYCNRSNPKIKYSFIIESIRKLAYFLTPPTGVIAQTSEAKQRKISYLGKNANIKIIPNPAPNFPLIEFTKENWIISVGRLHIEKGFLRLIESFSRVKNREGWVLVIVGDGIHVDIIKKKVLDLKLENEVNFTGKVKNIHELLSRSKIFVLASHNEGFPNALLEAMSVGLACVSFDIVAGPRDIIKNGVNGILIPDGDLSALTTTLENLIASPSMINKLGDSAKESIKNYDIKNITNDYLSFILSGLKK